MSDLLQQIQQLQFNRRGEAEALLLDFIIKTFPQLDAVQVELRPQVISLNSFNGFLTLRNGDRLFFKTHTEEDNRLDEYYNAAMLADAGYPVIQPLYSSTKAGQHLLIYEVIESPSVFDVAWQIEQGDHHELNPLKNAQNASDRALFDCYLATLQTQDLQSAQNAPIHQLFYHRLTGGRMDRFYGDFLSDHGENVVLADIQISMGELAQKRWVINGQEFDNCLADVVRQAIDLLKPQASGVSIIGHGDAHNGNVFFEESGLTYFDPAFAGRHHPLLDLAKPLFHNVFAMWMYFPEIKNEMTDVSVYLTDTHIRIEHDYQLPEVRHIFLQSKIQNTLIPILKHLNVNNQLRTDWRVYLKSALFCCPFLTLNLLDQKRFPPKITALGFAMAMQMGAESHGKRSLIDAMLDEVQAAL